MSRIDHSWDLTSNRIILDETLNMDKLGWKHGDMFKITNVDGRAMLVKVDPIEAFATGHPVNTKK